MVNIPGQSALYDQFCGGAFELNILALEEKFRFSKALSSHCQLGEVGGSLGYFLFGERSICFGQCFGGSAAPNAGGKLYDAKADVRTEDRELHLPFDPGEVIDNLRLERYTLDRDRLSGRLSTGPLIRSLYYLLRPLLSVRTRRHLQRLALRDWSRRTFPRWPVDRTVEHLLDELLVCELQAKQLDKIPFIWFWPEGHSNCAIVTHDVETETGRRFCSDLMDADDAFGIKASFQVVPEKRYAVSHAYLESMRSRGFEINVQDWNHDGHLFREREEFLRRAARINQFARDWSANGFRAGMLYRNVDWYDALDVAYDMSIPNVAHLDPQRGGCCTVFPYFIGDVLEIPVTTTQDYSLFHILGDYTTALWKQQCNLIRESHGLMSFIIHPDYLLEERAMKSYHSLLALLAEFRERDNTWIPLPGEVNTWWRQRSEMSIVAENGRFRIVGPGSERARVAFARVENGQLSYSLEQH